MGHFSSVIFSVLQDMSPMDVSSSERIIRLMLLITVLTGFYDLYKNVPMLKATVSRLFVPLFDWIVTWEMISRLKYLGTMLFLNNFQQAFTWSFKIVCAAKSVLSVLTKPNMGRLLEVLEFTLPLWNTVQLQWYSADDQYSAEIIWPFWFIFSTMFNIANSALYPVIQLVREILAAPFGLVVALSSFVADFFDDIVDVLRQTSSTLSSLYQVGSASRAPALISETAI